MTAVVLSLSLWSCGDSTLKLNDEDGAAEDVVAAEVSVSSELTAARPLLSRNLGIVAREAWGARPAGSCRRGQVPNRVIVHHVGGSVPDSRGWLSWYDREVRVTRGWCDLMYHFGIDEQGIIYEMVATGVEGAHASDANTRTVAIVLMGDYTSRSPSAPQIASLQKLMVAVANEYRFPANRQTVLGHRQVGQTSCPGNTAYPKLDAWVASAGSTPPVTPPVATGAVQVPAQLPAFTVSASGLRLASVGAQRLLDTRASQPLSGGVVSQSFTSSQVGGATAVALGVALVQPEGDTFLSVFGGGVPAATSTVNAVKGTVRANQTIVSLSSGAVSMYSPQRTHVVVDEQARFGPSGAGFTALGPTRALDTRNGAPIGAGEVRAISLVPFGVPASAKAAQLGLAAISRGQPGFISVLPCGSSPSTSSLNFATDGVASSAALASLSNGNVCVFSNVPVDLIIDVAGYYDAGGASLTLVNPARVLDTRSGEGGWKGVPTPGQVLRVELSSMPGWQGSSAVAFTLTGINAQAPGFARVWDCTGEAAHSSQNAEVGAVVATFGVVRSSGSLCITTLAPQHLVLDLVGVY
jgi:hypothetical protein